MKTLKFGFNLIIIGERAYTSKINLERGNLKKITNYIVTMIRVIQLASLVGYS